MAGKTRLILFLIAAGLAGWSHESHAARGQAIENTRDLCVEAARAQERKDRIPQHLLAAIAMTESGRSDPETGENFAWPWTVRAEGKGRYFTTKEEARAEVEILLSRGVKNIDVGCMQINLHYHWDAFQTLDQAFDPAANAAYAARYLKAKFDTAKDWLTAAGQYHSETPENFRVYRIKVLSHWNRLKREDGAPVRTVAKDEEKKDKPEVRLIAIDQAATDRLNALGREKRRAERFNDRQIDAGRRRLDDLNNWRAAKNRTLRLEAVVAQRMAEMELRRQENLRDFERQDRDETFAEKRQAQLDRWRATGSLVGDQKVTAER